MLTILRLKERKKTKGKKKQEGGREKHYLYY
jgi:hypothetical protein